MQEAADQFQVSHEDNRGMAFMKHGDHLCLLMLVNDIHALGHCNASYIRALRLDQESLAVQQTEYIIKCAVPSF